MILVIADRDGTLNHNNRSKQDGPYYVLSPNQFEWMDGAKEGIVELQKAGILVHVVTSQNCISEGKITLAEVGRIHRKMNQELVKMGGQRVQVSVVYGVKESDHAKARAKANSVSDAIRGYIASGLAISEVWVIGDTEGDILAGKLLPNCKTVHVELEFTSEKDKYVEQADHHVKSFKGAVGIILTQRKER